MDHWASWSVWLGICVSILCGCSDADAPAAAPPDEYLGLQAPADGFQVRSSGERLLPGDDAEYCEVAEFPGEAGRTYYVKGFELGNAPHSHHLIVSRARPGTAAEAALRAIRIGDKVECLSAPIKWGEDQIEVLAGVQTPYGGVDYPAGVGVVLTGGERFIFDYHYINPTPEPIEAKSALNVHLTDAANVAHLARGFYFTNYLVDVPARSKRSFIAECSFSEDVQLGGLQRHTHQTGTDFSVWFKGGARDGEHIWTSTDWRHQLGYAFPEPVTVAAGEGLRFECAFDNPTDHAIRYGVNATDEMCVVGGAYWSDSENPKLQNCNAIWADADGIAHPADEAGGFPPASASDALLCQLGQSLIPEGKGAGCAECVCGACSSVLLKCVTDADCAALLGCFTGGCTSLESCMNACESQVRQHSSAVGLVEQLAGCVSHGCSSCSVW